MTCAFRSCRRGPAGRQGAGLWTHRVMCPVVMSRLSRRSTSAAALLNTPGVGLGVRSSLACGQPARRRNHAAPPATRKLSAARLHKRGARRAVQATPRPGAPGGRCAWPCPRTAAHVCEAVRHGVAAVLGHGRVSTRACQRCGQAACEGPACVHVAPGWEKQGEGTRGKGNSWAPGRGRRSVLGSCARRHAVQSLCHALVTHLGLFRPARREPRRASVPGELVTRRSLRLVAAQGDEAVQPRGRGAHRQAMRGGRRRTVRETRRARRGPTRQRKGEWGAARAARGTHMVQPFRRGSHRLNQAGRAGPQSTTASCRRRAGQRRDSGGRAHMCEEPHLDAALGDAHHPVQLVAAVQARGQRVTQLESAPVGGGRTGHLGRRCLVQTLRGPPALLAGLAATHASWRAREDESSSLGAEGVALGDVRREATRPPNYLWHPKGPCRTRALFAQTPTVHRHGGGTADDVAASCGARGRAWRARALGEVERRSGEASRCATHTRHGDALHSSAASLPAAFFLDFLAGASPPREAGTSNLWVALAASHLAMAPASRSPS